MNKKENYHDKFIDFDFYDDEKLLSELVEDNLKTFSELPKKFTTTQPISSFQGGKIVDKDINIPTFQDLKNDKSKLIGATTSTIKGAAKTKKSDEKVTKAKAEDKKTKPKDESKVEPKVEEKSAVMSEYEKYKFDKLQAKYSVLDENGFKFMESQSTDSYIFFKNVSAATDVKGERFEEDQIGAIDGKVSAIGTNEFLVCDKSATSGKDLLMESYNAGNGLTRLYQNTKSNLVAQHPNYMNEINFMATAPVKNVANTPFDKYIEFALTSNYLTKFIRPLVYRRKDLKLVTKGSECKEHISLIKLPKEITWLVNHIQLYFSQVKEQLSLNNETGFYMMNVEVEKDGKKLNIEFPVMCKHIYMTYDGRSLDEISEECSKAGVCKFCGDSLVSSGIDDTTQLPPTITDMIYKLIDVFDGDVSDQDYFIKIFNNFSKVVNTIVKTDDQNYESKASATASLYAYKIIQDAISKNIIEPSSAANVLKKISDNCSVIGWDVNKMNEIIAKGIFQDTSDFIQVLRNEVKTKISGLSLDDIFSLSIDDIKTLKTEHKLELLRQILNDERYQTILLDSIAKLKDMLQKDKRINVDATDFDKFDSFEKIVKTWCPVNIIHKFASGTCSHCGIKENFKNVDVIYKKFEKQFINDFDLKTENKFNLSSKVDVIDITKLIAECKDIQTYFMKKLDLSNKEYQDFLKAVPSVRRILLNTLEILFAHTNKPLNTLKMEEILALVIYVDKHNMSETLLPSLSLMNQSVDDLMSACDNYDYEDIDSDDE